VFYFRYNSLKNSDFLVFVLLYFLLDSGQLCGTFSALSRIKFEDATYRLSRSAHFTVELDFINFTPDNEQSNVVIFGTVSYPKIQIVETVRENRV